MLLHVTLEVAAVGFELEDLGIAPKCDSLRVANFTQQVIVVTRFHHIQ